jgi:Na+-transporting NADH:ubiquinone oxidoreductase subunit NqrF
MNAGKVLRLRCSDPVFGHYGMAGQDLVNLGFRSPRDFLFRKELEEMKTRNPNLSVLATMSNPGEELWTGFRGRIDIALLRSAELDLAGCRAHVCGPPDMMDAVKTALLGLGVAENQVRTEAFGTITRDPTTRSARSTEIAGKVRFQASDAAATVPAGATILDAADELGVFIDNACRSGTCGSCRARLISGHVSMAVQDGLTDHDKSEGYILTCQAKVQGEAVVDA